MMENIKDLLTVFPTHGRLEWIGLRTERRGSVDIVQATNARAGFGLEGDRTAKGRGGSKRQVTLIQHEHFSVLSSFVGRSIQPEQLRRNLVISGINLLALKGVRFRVGEALLEGTGPCAPCSRMEEVLGRGGYNAMRGHGGITAIILESGSLNVGDQVRVATD